MTQESVQSDSREVRQKTDVEGAGEEEGLMEEAEKARLRRCVKATKAPGQCQETYWIKNKEEENVIKSVVYKKRFGKRCLDMPMGFSAECLASWGRMAQ